MYIAFDFLLIVDNRRENESIVRWDGVVNNLFLCDHRFKKAVVGLVLQPCCSSIKTGYRESFGTEDASKVTK